MEINDDEVKNLRSFIIVSAIVVVLLIIMAGLAIVVVRYIENIEVDIRTITIDIDDRQCNVSAELDYSPDIDVEPKNLMVILENEEVLLEYEKKLVWGLVNEEQFTEIVEKEKIRIKGSVGTKNGFGMSSDKDIDTDVDLSFLGEILSGVTINDAKLSTKFPFTTVVEFNMTVEMDRDVNIFANNTGAIISNGVDENEVDLVSLEINSDGIGNGRVEMPTSTLLSLALWGRNVTISAWGLEAEFRFPF